MRKPSPHKPPFDFWLWLAIAGILIIASIFGLFGPLPFTPSSARGDVQHHSAEG